MSHRRILHLIVARALIATPIAAAGESAATLALRDAAFAGDIEKTQQAIADGADVNSATEHEGETMLHLACVWGKAEVVKALLAAGANPNVRAWGDISLRMTPLSWCTCAAAKEAVGAMVAAGANVNDVVNDQDGGQLTVLDIARGMGERGEEMVHLFLDNS